MLSHDEQVAILDKAIREYEKQGWHLWKRATPYEVCLRRKSGLLARQFMPLWVEEDGRVIIKDPVEGGRIQVVPFVFFDGD